MKAIWNDEIIAESDQTQLLEGNHYFPLDAVRMDLLTDSDKQTHCPWKGDASYYNVVVGDRVNPDAAWYYPDPKTAAGNIAGHVAFWRGVIVSE
jgi:uncharacterized protein (DUF427 family)